MPGSKKGEERINIHVSANKPYSESQHRNFDPDKFPLHVSLYYLKHYDYLAEDLKATLKDVPKQDYRFRKKINPYVGHSVNLYFKDIDSMRPLIPWLKGKELVQAPLLGEDEKLLPYQIMDKAKQVIQECQKGQIL